MRNSLLLVFFLISCNPVKRVLNDREKFNKVAEVVISSGMCANDTVTLTKSDTTIVTDTIFEAIMDTQIIRQSDTIKVPKTQIIRKTITIRDTVKAVVVDNARVRLLEAKLAFQTELTNQYKDKAGNRLKWLIWILVAIGIYLIRKPIIAFIKWHS